MNKFIRSTLLTGTALSMAAGCSVPQPESNHSGEIITCEGPWNTIKLDGNTLVYDLVVGKNGIADEMGIRRSDNLGFVAMALHKANPNADILSYPLGCEVQTGQSDAAINDAVENNAALWYAQGESQTGAQLIITAPTFNPDGKVSN